MNLKQLLLLIVAGCVIGGIGWSIHKQRTASWQSTGQGLGQKLLGNFPINDVAQVAIKTSQGELNLVKADLWQVKERNGYPANFSEVSDLIRKTAELKPVQSVKVGASQLGRLELLPPGKGTNAGTLLEFKDKNGKLLVSLLLGKKHMKQAEANSPFGGEGWPDGRFILASNVPPLTVWLVAESLANVEPKPEQWINKDFFKVDRLKSIEVTSTQATNNWKFSRETENGEMKLADKQDKEEIDTTKVSSLNSALSFPSFNDVIASGAKPETTGLDKPIAAKLETFDNFIYTFKIGKALTNEDRYISLAVSADIVSQRTPGKDEKAEDKDKLDKEFKEKTEKLKTKLAQEKSLESWVFLVSKWTVEPLLQNRPHWFVEKKTDPAKPGALVSPPGGDIPAGLELPRLPSGEK